MEHKTLRTVNTNNVVLLSTLHDLLKITQDTCITQFAEKKKQEELEL